MKDNHRNEQILEVQDLKVSFVSHERAVTAVDNAAFVLNRGQILGIVGESGSGKSVTSLSILDLISDNKKSKTEGKIFFKGAESTIDLLATSNEILQKIRGRRISMVFQEPMSSLNPVKKCGWQVNEIFTIHHMHNKEDRKDKIYQLLRQVKLDDVERIYNSYPHELSGGQLQRVNIAMALAGEPDILICDEPTTALDVTVQKEIILLLKEIVRSKDIAMIFVCHDLDVVAELCDSVMVMYQGKIVEKGILPDVFSDPKHLYTKALLKCKPKLAYSNIVLPTVSEILNGKYIERIRPLKKSEKDNEAILKVEHLTMKFITNPLSIFGKKKYFTAVSDVSFEVGKGEILGIVGESGSGKSTIANCVAGILSHTSGHIIFDGQEVNSQSFANNSALRRRIQLVFQDPYSSLNPRMKIGRSILEPIEYHKIGKKSEWKTRVINLLKRVGLSEEYYDRYPHELSGGQRQRVCIARALAVEPDLLICDECVSALDVSVQAQILNLLDDLKNSLGLTMLFISHDLSVVQYISDQVIVMNKGEIVESGDAHTVMTSPKAQYTRQLVDSIPNSI
jgi:peptide/nickel transport system ATP-binding protein